jgi:hypothetical protein
VIAMRGSDDDGAIPQLRGQACAFIVRPELPQTAHPDLARGHLHGRVAACAASDECRKGEENDDAREFHRESEVPGPPGISCALPR